MCLDIVQQMAYAPSEDKYDELYTQFRNSAPAAVCDYFDENWHPIRHQWTLGMKYTSGNFLNSTNNRLESLNAKLKSVIPRYSSLEEFVDKFFLVTRVLHSERDHKASITAQKVPVVYHGSLDPGSVKYMKYLTPYAYKYVANQVDLMNKVKIANIEDEKYYVESSEGNLTVTSTTCQCMHWQSMRLLVVTILLYGHTVLWTFLTTHCVTNGGLWSTTSPLRESS